MKGPIVYRWRWDPRVLGSPVNPQQGVGSQKAFFNQLKVYVNVFMYFFSPLRRPSVTLNLILKEIHEHMIIKNCFLKAQFHDSIAVYSWVNMELHRNNNDLILEFRILQKSSCIIFRKVLCSWESSANMNVMF